MRVPRVPVPALPEGHFVAPACPAAIAPLASLTCSVRLSEHWIIRAVFDRVTSNYNRDSDIFLLGFGYRWPR